MTPQEAINEALARQSAISEEMNTLEKQARAHEQSAKEFRTRWSDLKVERESITVALGHHRAQAMVNSHIADAEKAKIQAETHAAELSSQKDLAQKLTEDLNLQKKQMDEQLQDLARKQAETEALLKKLSTQAASVSPPVG